MPRAEEQRHTYGKAGRGRKPALSVGHVDALRGIVRTGCAWRLLPKRFPPWACRAQSLQPLGRGGRVEAMHDRLQAQ